MPVAFAQSPGIAILLCLSATSCFKEARSSDVSMQEHLLGCAVRIRSERSEGVTKVTGHGTAFAVDMSNWGYEGSKYLLSAAHNALDEKNRPYPTLMIESRNPDAPKWSKCRVVAFDKNLDICLLEANDSLSQQSVLAACEAKVGQLVILAGSPRGIPLSLYEGTLTDCSLAGSGHSAACLPFDHGCSGGPFFNAKGEVIGVAVAGVPKGDDMDKNIGLFVPLASVTHFLEDNRAGLLRKNDVAGGTKAIPIPFQIEGKRENASTVPAGSTQNRLKHPVKNSPPRVELDEKESFGQLPAAQFSPEKSQP